MNPTQLSVACLAMVTINVYSLPCLAQQISLLTEDFPPYTKAYGNGSVEGPAVEKVSEVMRRANLAYHVEALPWIRAFEQARNRPKTCVFSTVRSPERESSFQWVGPLFQGYSMAVFGRIDDKRRPKSIEDMRNYRLGTFTQSAVAEFLARREFRVDLADYDSLNPQKLLHRRFDFWIAGKDHGIAILRSQNLQGQIKVRFEFNHAALYLACNREIDEGTINRMKKAWQTVDMDGTSKAIDKKYDLLN